jgi:glycerol-3-phosphate cytidylyltransferase
MGLNNKKIIYTAGTYDLFHFGHLNILLKAKKLGDYLIVGVSTDALISRYKGLKPIICFRDRLSIIQELRCVNKVIKQDRFFDVKQLKKYNVNTIVLGDDWQEKSFPELEKCLKELNIKMIYVPYTKRLSTSKIKNKIIKHAFEIIEAQTKRKYAKS